MRRCDSVIQKCVVGGRSVTESSGERCTLSSIPLSRWHPSRNEKKTAEVCWLARSRTETGSGIEQFLGFAATVKTYRFSWPVYYSLPSSAKFDIVRV